MGEWGQVMLWAATTGKVRGWLVGVAAFVAAIGYAYLRGRKSAVDRAKARQAEQRLDAALKAKEVEHEIEILDDVGLADRANEWLLKP